MEVSNVQYIIRQYHILASKYLASKYCHGGYRFLSYICSVVVGDEFPWRSGMFSIVLDSITPQPASTQPVSIAMVGTNCRVSSPVWAIGHDEHEKEWNKLVIVNKNVKYNHKCFIVLEHNAISDQKEAQIIKHTQSLQVTPHISLQNWFGHKIRIFSSRLQRISSWSCIPLKCILNNDKQIILQQSLI